MPSWVCFSAIGYVMINIESSCGVDWKTKKTDWVRQRKKERERERETVRSIRSESRWKKIKNTNKNNWRHSNKSYVKPTIKLNQKKGMNKTRAKRIQKSNRDVWFLIHAHLCSRTIMAEPQKKRLCTDQFMKRWE